MEELRLQAQASSAAWFDVSSSPLEKVVLVKMCESSSNQAEAISHSLTIERDLTWRLYVYGKLVSRCTALSQFPTHLQQGNLQVLLSTISQLHICAGHPDKHLLDFVSAKKGQLLSASGNVTAFLDTSGPVMLNGQRCPTTVRSAECQVLTSALKCPQCVSYRNTMRAMYHRWQKRKSSSPIHSTSTHTNDRWLTTPERKIKTSLLKLRVRSAESTVKYLKDKINASTRKLGVDVDDSLHSGLESIMSANTSQILDNYPEGSFHRLFWDQQAKALSTAPRQRRWHPMLIRWCLHLKMLSTAAYDSLRGILQLPCGRTLQDYTRWIKADCGVQPEVTEQLLKETNLDSLEEWQKYVAVVFDEMKIKEGIVYNKHDCRIVGFVNFGNTNNELLSLVDGCSQPPVAKHMLAFMVRGIFIRLTFPYAQYPTTDITSDLLYPLVWEVVKNLECAGFRVISLTGDKASVNQTFFQMNQSAKKTEKVHKIRNPYSIDGSYIYFISDVPHLIKTTRNCWANSFGHSYKRAMWVSQF